MRMMDQTSDCHFGMTYCRCIPEYYCEILEVDEMVFGDRVSSVLASALASAPVNALVYEKV